MIVRIALAAAIAMVTSAAPAADLNATHTEVRLPSAKGLLPAFRPLAVEACPSVKAVQVTPPGKIASPAPSGACAVAIASR